ncbi:DUF2157 domain-containing protein [Clostridiisalibacter paucivorans]|uniref:DUF2157 domain-containing protein n=1 Tax=Clostridiisalibacter paucivorans TaxID=408753 RepID=UPI00047C7AD9|nr:DUF2157 domain-containing protein [Clostridiisalibacter paucivorans]
MDKKRQVTKKEYNFLASEIKFIEEKNIINREQKDKILGLYKRPDETNFIKIISLIGAILVGLGVLTFIASNWEIISKPFKFIIILLGYLLTFFGGYKSEDQYPKTGRALIYISVLIFGSGIFLVGQMFNYGGEVDRAFLLWTIGILPMGMFLMDKYILTFSIGTSIMYLITGMDTYLSMDWTVIVLLGIIISLYIYNNKLLNSALVTLSNNLLLLLYILYLVIEWRISATYVIILFLGIGLFMYIFPFKTHNKVLKIQGNIVFGFSGLLLTIPNVWEELSYIDTGNIPALLFAILYILFLFFLTKKESLISLIFIFITIFRYYFDRAYDFMPKSLFFIIGGILLIGFGYYFERARKRIGERDEI